MIEEKTRLVIMTNNLALALVALGLHKLFYIN